MQHDLPLEFDKHSLLSQQKGKFTYVSLFSSAGVGCYGFKLEDFSCIATVELLPRRLKIQEFNNKCVLPSGYICGDMTMEETKQRVFSEIALWQKEGGLRDVDVVIATPPCQGMSVANHKKKDELKRNSLVVESIKMVGKIKPKFFVFENVRAFLQSECTDVDGVNRPISDAIERNLSGVYNIHSRILNFKDYGNPSSRTRTLVLGVRRDLKDITPFDIFPSRCRERTLRETIGHLPSLKTMGEVSPDDIYHNFRRYPERMVRWIELIKEGESAFDNTDPSRIPHKECEDGVVFNTRKNGDKYTRQCWDRVAPCIHTRNDILASQNTVHPVDNRVFSIREVMLMMSVPESFSWSSTPFEIMNQMSKHEKELFLKKEEMNIRQNLGEAVPTVIFQSVARKIKKALTQKRLSNFEIKQIVLRENLTTLSELLKFIKKNQDFGFSTLSKIAEFSNPEKEQNAAFYTRSDICYAVVKFLPDPKNFSKIDILEPAVGVGNFLPILIEKYRDVGEVNIDVVDIDRWALDVLRELVGTLDVPKNVCINYIHADFLTAGLSKRYDVVVGNPPYKKLSNNNGLLRTYKANVINRNTNNIFSFFVEKAVSIGDSVALIVPKSLLNAPEFNETRVVMNSKKISALVDYGESAFDGVKIETISFVIENKKKMDSVFVQSYPLKKMILQNQKYITDCTFPYWLIYRDVFFDSLAKRMEFDLFRVYRDRKITRKMTKSEGRFRVLKSRNIVSNGIEDIKGYDAYVDGLDGLDVAKFMGKKCILVPNLTYSPRACFLPNDCIADGSVAILTPKNAGDNFTEDDLAFYATPEFREFYRISRNLGTRSLNIDSNSVFFFGKLT